MPVRPRRSDRRRVFLFSRWPAPGRLNPEVRPHRLRRDLSPRLRGRLAEVSEPRHGPAHQLDGRFQFGPERRPVLRCDAGEVLLANVQPGPEGKATRPTPGGGRATRGRPTRAGTCAFRPYRSVGVSSRPCERHSRAPTPQNARVPNRNGLSSAKQVGGHEVFDEGSELVTVLLARGGDGLDVRCVVERHHPPQGVRRELLHERLREPVQIFRE